jgi:hypothetical protein
MFQMETGVLKSEGLIYNRLTDILNLFLGGDLRGISMVWGKLRGSDYTCILVS